MKCNWTKILLIVSAPFAAVALFFFIGHLVKGNIFDQFVFSDQVRVVKAGNAEFAEFVDKPGQRGLHCYHFFEIRIWYKFLDETDYRLLHMSSFDALNVKPDPEIDEVSCIDAIERFGYSYMAATPNIGIDWDPYREETLLPPETVIYIADAKERRFLMQIEVGFDEYGDIAINYYGKCNLPRIDKSIHSHCRVSTKFYGGWPLRKKDRKRFEAELIEYESRMMKNALFVQGLREAFDSFDLNKDCLDSLVEHYGKTEENQDTFLVKNIY